jgi:hypothetical protein
VVTTGSVDAVQYRERGSISEPPDFVGHFAACPRTGFGPVELLPEHQAADRLKHGAAYTESGYALVNPMGLPVRPEAYSDRFAVLCRQAEVPVVGLHDVRHTLATIMHRAGLAPSDAAALLGHTVAVHPGHLCDTDSEGRTGCRY